MNTETYTPPSQEQLAAYWQDDRRHGFKQPKFDVSVSEYDKRGNFVQSHRQYVQAWTADEAKAAAVRQLREFRGGKFRAVSVQFSQPVRWGVAGATA